MKKYMPHMRPCECECEWNLAFKNCECMHSVHVVSFGLDNDQIFALYHATRSPNWILIIHKNDPILNVSTIQKHMDYRHTHKHTHFCLSELLVCFNSTATLFFHFQDVATIMMEQRSCVRNICMIFISCLKIYISWFFYFFFHFNSSQIVMEIW